MEAVQSTECCVHLYEDEVRSNLCMDTYSDTFPISQVTSVVNAETGDKAVSLDDLQNVLKRKRENHMKRLTQNEESDESECSEEEESSSGSESDEGSFHKSETGDLSSYEKMVQKKRAERLAFLESLKMNEVKTDFYKSVQGLNSVSCPVRRVKNREKKTLLPSRKSGRLENLDGVDFSEHRLMKSTWNNAKLRNQEDYVKLKKKMQPKEDYKKSKEKRQPKEDYKKCKEKRQPKTDDLSSFQELMEKRKADRLAFLKSLNINEEDYEKLKKKLQPKTGELTSYEKRTEKRKAERLAFLESLKIYEVKTDFYKSVQGLNSVSCPVRSVKKKKKTLVPSRKSRRLENLDCVNFSERRLMNNTWNNAKLQDQPPAIPTELSFNEASNSEELYETFIKDISIKESLSDQNHFSYDRSVIQNLNLDNYKVAKIVPEVVTALTWYPSADHLILAAGCKTGNIGIWNVDSESSPHLFKVHNGLITNLQFNPYNHVEMFSSSQDGTLRCGDMIKHMFSEVYNENKKVNSSERLDCTYFDFVSPVTYLVAHRDGKVVLVDKRSLRPVKRCIYQEHCVETVSVHPVNKYYFLTAEKRGLIHIWDLRKWQEDPVAKINHVQGVTSAFFSPVTGNSILTTSCDVFIYDSSYLAKGIQMIQQMTCKKTRKMPWSFRATWLPNSDEAFTINSVDCPGRIDVFDNDMSLYGKFMFDQMAEYGNYGFHPFRPAFAKGQISGNAFVAT